MARHLEDDGFHEIQLNGKQLVFLFMAATVVSVVIFLCGVLVGRGVQDRGEAEAAALTEAPAADFKPPSSAQAISPQSSDPTSAAPPSSVEDLSYYKRLGEEKQPVEELKPAADKPAPKPERLSAVVREPTAPPKPLTPPKEAPRPAAAAAPPAVTVSRPTDPPKATAVPAPAAPVAATAATAATAGATAGSGYVVQVAALNLRSEADAIASKLVAKGYSAFVASPAGGTQVFRVRVGTFKTKGEAETIAAKLQREEQFKPWVTR